MLPSVTLCYLLLIGNNTRLLSVTKCYIVSPSVTLYTLGCSWVSVMSCMMAECVTCVAVLYVGTKPVL